jgi:hypothetical protein
VREYAGRAAARLFRAEQGAEKKRAAQFFLKLRKITDAAV